MHLIFDRPLLNKYVQDKIQNVNLKISIVTVMYSITKVFYWMLIALYYNGIQLINTGLSCYDKLCSLNWTECHHRNNLTVTYFCYVHTGYYTKSPKYS